MESTVSNMRRSEIFPEISGIIQNKNDKIPYIVKKLKMGQIIRSKKLTVIIFIYLLLIFFDKLKFEV